MSIGRRALGSLLAHRAFGSFLARRRPARRRAAGLIVGRGPVPPGGLVGDRQDPVRPGLGG